LPASLFCSLYILSLHIHMSSPFSISVETFICNYNTCGWQLHRDLVEASNTTGTGMTYTSQKPATSRSAAAATSNPASVQEDLAHAVLTLLQQWDSLRRVGALNQFLAGCFATHMEAFSSRVSLCLPVPTCAEDLSAALYACNPAEITLDVLVPLSQYTCRCWKIVHKHMVISIHMQVLITHGYLNTHAGVGRLCTNTWLSQYTCRCW